MCKNGNFSDFLIIANSRIHMSQYPRFSNTMKYKYARKFFKNTLVLNP